jgi:thiol-disulfide isomerase/thioredoxin
LGLNLNTRSVPLDGVRRRTSGTGVVSPGAVAIVLIGSLAMMSRLLSVFGLVALMAGFAPAQDKPSIKAQIQEAQEVANEDLPKAIAILEKALKISPEDHNALFLLGAMTVVQGEKSEDKAERFAMYRKSTEAFAKIQKLFRDLTPNEKRFLKQSRIGEARVLASEGKPEEGLVAIKKAMEAGFDDIDALTSDKELVPICKLPAFKLAIEEGIRAGVVAGMASFKSFPFDFELKDTDEKPVSLADYKGKVTIVDIWGTWCPPCREEIPHFVDLYNTLKDKGLDIVGINCNEQGPPDQVRQTIKKFARENKIPYKCVLNDETTEQKVPGFEGYPTTLFLDRSGKVRMMFVGNPGKAKLEMVVNILLADSSKPDEPKAK